MDMWRRAKENSTAEKNDGVKGRRKEEWGGKRNIEGKRKEKRGGRE